MKRTHTCGDLSEKNVGSSVTLQGWVDTIRDHGSLSFIDLRDRYGEVQLVFKKDSKFFDRVKDVGKEFVIQVGGKVQKRKSGTENNNLPTGEIEVVVEDLKILSKSEPLPIDLKDESMAGEDSRLKYRYLDLRRKILQKNLIIRHKIIMAIRKYFDEKEFIEVETPILAKSTPEGARDYLVPSRVHKGKFYALPQSPQLFKQMLMVAGFDKYFQIAKCMRDEDLRADRQPEFTQIDVEMSFVEMEDVQNIMEGMMKEVLEVVGKKIKTPFPRMDYDKAMNDYGSDKPDLRFDLSFVDLTDIFIDSGFESFKGKTIKGIPVKNGSKLSKKDFDDLEEVAKTYKARGLVTGKVVGSKIDSNISKHLTDNEMKKIIEKCDAKESDLIFIIGGDRKSTLAALGQVRLKLGEKLGLQKGDAFLWIVNFPLFAWNEEERRLESEHHPFTRPQEAYLNILETEPLKAKAMHYDMVWNGFELGSGSIRIHDPELQEKIFKIIGLSKKEIKEKFGFMTSAFRYGPPPHGGIALGIDRIVMIMTESKSLRDIIAFPKNKMGVSMMDDAPSEVDDKQLKELGIKLVEE